MIAFYANYIGTYIGYVGYVKHCYLQVRMMSALLSIKVTCINAFIEYYKTPTCRIVHSHD